MPIFVTDGCEFSSEIAIRWTSLDLSDDKSTLVQVMGWCRQATSHNLNQCWPRSLVDPCRHMASLGHNDLKRSSGTLLIFQMLSFILSVFGYSGEQRSNDFREEEDEEFRVVTGNYHDVVMPRKRFPRCWSFVRGIPRSPVDSLTKGQLGIAFTFTLVLAWILYWINNQIVRELRRHESHVTAL